MRKLFISQPMNGKTEEYIKNERQHLIETTEKVYEEKFEVIDSYIENAPENANSLWYLGESLKLMSQADVVVFAKDWELYRGCKIEHQAAIDYGISDVIESYNKVE